LVEKCKEKGRPSNKSFHFSKTQHVLKNGPARKRSGLAVRVEKEITQRGGGELTDVIKN